MAVKDSQNQVYQVTHTGHVAGTFESGSRDDPWSIDSRDDVVAANWANIAAGWKGNAQASASLDAVNLLNAVVGVLGIVLAVIALFLGGHSGNGGHAPATGSGG
jgi:hypothetical protein